MRFEERIVSVLAGDTICRNCERVLAPYGAVRADPNTQASHCLACRKVAEYGVICSDCYNRLCSYAPDSP